MLIQVIISLKSTVNINMMSDKLHQKSHYFFANIRHPVKDSMLHGHTVQSFMRQPIPGKTLNKLVVETFVPIKEEPHTKFVLLSKRPLTNIIGMT